MKNSTNKVPVHLFRNKPMQQVHVIVKLNEELATARRELEKTSTTASESWAKLQGGVNDAFESLSKSVSSTYDRLKQG